MACFSSLEDETVAFQAHKRYGPTRQIQRTHQGHKSREFQLNQKLTEELKVGIIRTSSIGDVILATACLNLLRDYLPHAKIVWLGKAPSLRLLKEAFPDIECIEIDRSLKIHEILNHLQDVSFLLDLQTNLRSRIIAHAFKSRFRKPIFSCPKNQLQRNRLILESRIYGRKRQLSTRATEALTLQFKQMRDSLFNALQVLKLIPKAQASARDGLVPFVPTEHFSRDTDWLAQIKGRRWIAIAPGASYETKQAPIEIFAESISRLKDLLADHAELQNLGLVYLGDANDQSVCKTLIEKIGWDGEQLNLAGALSLWENAVLLQNCVCLLANDSALAHLAESVDTPSLVFFGPTVEGFGFAPRKPESRAFSVLLGCRPCSKHGKSPCRFGDKLCFWQISRDDVALHMKDLLVGTKVCE